MNRLMSATPFHAMACIMQFSISVETFETPELAHTNALVDDISPKHQRPAFKYYVHIVCGIT